jgi:hypothetical protein
MSPADNAIVAPACTLVIGSVARADGFRFFLKKDTASVYESLSASDTTFVWPDSLVPGQAYNWTAQAFSVADTGPRAESWLFRVEADTSIAIDSIKPSGELRTDTTVTASVQVVNHSKVAITYSLRYVLKKGNSTKVDISRSGQTIQAGETRILHFGDVEFGTGETGMWQCPVSVQVGDKVFSGVDSVDVYYLDAEALAIVAPGDEVFAGDTVQCSVKVKNNSSREARLTAQLVIEQHSATLYSASATATISPNNDETLSLTDWAIPDSLRDSATARLVVSLEGDQNPSNDTTPKDISIKRMDAKLDSILVPSSGSIRKDSSLSPRVRVRNLSNVKANIALRCTLHLDATVKYKWPDITLTLAAGESSDVTLTPSDPLQDTGEHRFVARVVLDKDVDTTNNRKEIEFRVVDRDIGIEWLAPALTDTVTWGAPFDIRVAVANNGNERFDSVRVHIRGGDRDPDSSRMLSVGVGETDTITFTYRRAMGFTTIRCSLAYDGDRDDDTRNDIVTRVVRSFEKPTPVLTEPDSLVPFGSGDTIKLSWSLGASNDTWPYQVVVLRDTTGTGVWRQTVAPSQTMSAVVSSISDPGVYWWRVGLVLAYDSLFPGTSFRFENSTYWSGWRQFWFDPGMTDSTPPVGFFCFPNPFSRDKEQTSFRLIAPGDDKNYSVVIYDLSGAVVATLDGKPSEAGRRFRRIVWPWDGKDRNDEHLPTGVYLAVLRDNDDRVVARTRVAVRP